MRSRVCLRKSNKKCFLTIWITLGWFSRVLHGNRFEDCHPTAFSAARKLCYVFSVYNVHSPVTMNIDIKHWLWNLTNFKMLLEFIIKNFLQRISMRYLKVGSRIWWFNNIIKWVILQLYVKDKSVKFRVKFVLEWDTFLYTLGYTQVLFKVQSAHLTFRH